MSQALEKLAIHGGASACNFTWPTWPLFDESDEQALLQVLRSGKWWFGERVQAFEREYAAMQGARFAVSCTNGTTAIEMGLRAVGVVEGDEVIVPCYSFIATASAVVTIGAIPVFADILPETLCLDPEDVAAKITSQTRAIVPVHVAGRIAEMDRLNQLAAEHQFVVLEDAAHAWGSQLDGKGAGTLSCGGTFSFQETKNLTAGEGGALVTNDESLADLCRSFTHCGRTKGAEWYDHHVLGSNLRMTEFQAALLSTQLSRLPEQLATRDRNAQHIDAALDGIASVSTLAPTPQMTRRSHHMYIFRLNTQQTSATRQQVIDALIAEGIPASAGWYRPLYQNQVFLRAHIGPAHGIRSPLADKGVDYRDTHCPVCEQVCEDAIWIPQNVLLGDEQQIEQLGIGLRKVLLQVEQLK